MFVIYTYQYTYSKVHTYTKNIAHIIHIYIPRNDKQYQHIHPSIVHKFVTSIRAVSAIKRKDHACFDLSCHMCGKPGRKTCRFFCLGFVYDRNTQYLKYYIKWSKMPRNLKCWIGHVLFFKNDNVWGYPCWISMFLFIIFCTLFRLIMPESHVRGFFAKDFTIFPPH